MSDLFNSSTRWILRYRWLTSLLGRFSSRLAAATPALLASLRQGLAIFRRPREALIAALWTVAVWLLTVLAAYSMFPAFELEIGFLGAVLLTAGLAAAVALPQAPGFLGVFQLAVTMILVGCSILPASCRSS